MLNIVTYLVIPTQWRTGMTIDRTRKRNRQISKNFKDFETYKSTIKMPMPKEEGKVIWNLVYWCYYWCLRKEESEKSHKVLVKSTPGMRYPFTDPWRKSLNPFTLENRNGSWRERFLGARHCFWLRGSGFLDAQCQHIHLYLKQIIKIGWTNIHENNRVV